LSGHFVTFEGVDGCGKSTQQTATATWLREQGMDVVETFEPGATALGAEIRRLLLDGGYVPAPQAEFMLFMADRAQHVHDVIRPALARGAIVLCDRYTDSTCAYQLAGRGLNADVLARMLPVAELGVRPVLTLWFDLPVEEALRRMRNRTAAGEAATRMDEECTAFHQAVRDGFESICKADPERVRRIDARGNVAEIQHRVREAVAHALGISA